MLITKELLEDIDACTNQVAIFAEEWPKGVELSLESVLRATELDLDIDWFAQHFLSALAQKAYDEAIALAQKAYDEVIAPAQKAYDEARAPALIAAIKKAR